MQPAYSASKGAVKNLVMSLARPTRRTASASTAWRPGWVITELSRGARENPKHQQIIGHPDGAAGLNSRNCRPILSLLRRRALRGRHAGAGGWKLLSVG